MVRLRGAERCAWLIGLTLSTIGAGGCQLLLGSNDFVDAKGGAAGSGGSSNDDGAASGGALPSQAGGAGGPAGDGGTSGTQQAGGDGQGGAPSCAGGCFDGSRCVDGADVAACGNDGGACVDCLDDDPCSMKSCEAGACASVDIDGTCPGGTCQSGTCVPCDGLECDVATCPVGQETSIHGKVFHPGGTLPLYNVRVYIPNGPLDPIVEGVSCEQCSSPLSGSPIAATLTDETGSFTLSNVPAGVDIEVVIEIGKWRRTMLVPAVTACTNTAIPDGFLRLPRNQSEGHIPKIALTTGAADALECLLRKVGLDASEFTSPMGSGRVNLYAGQQGGTSVDQTGTAFPTSPSLWGSLTTLSQYDAVLLGCEGSAPNTTAAQRQAMFDYVAAGGRVFMEHFHYTWLANGPAPWPMVATFNEAGNPPPSPSLAVVDPSFPKGQALASWLVSVGASPTAGQFTMVDSRGTVPNVLGATRRWVSSTMTPPNVEQFGFNDPIGAPPQNQCGRVAFSDIHVGAGDSGGVNPFPTGCISTGMTGQEKELLFMLFDLMACVGPDDTAPSLP